MDPCYEPAKESHRSMSPLQTCRCLESFQGGGEIISIKRAIVETRPRGPEKAMTPEPSSRWAGNIGRGRRRCSVGDGVAGAGPGGAGRCEIEKHLAWRSKGFEGLPAGHGKHGKAVKEVSDRIRTDCSEEKSAGGDLGRFGREA